MDDGGALRPTTMKARGVGERIGIVSARTLVVSPAQTCVIEFENVLAETLSAPIIPVFDAQAPHTAEARFDRLIFVAVSYWELSKMFAAASTLRAHTGKIYGYVFDSFHNYLLRWTERFPRPLRSTASLARHEVRNVSRFDHLFIPTKLTLEAQQAFFDVPFSFLPIGVDAVRFGSAQRERPIDVNGYGRQPPEISHHLADIMNRRSSEHLYHYTNHLRVTGVLDPRRHRELFWHILRRSKLALAYAPEAYDPGGNFDCSFVGQRWFESMAAGCVVVGRAPAAPERQEMFDWEDALIELPDEPDAAWDTIQSILADPERIRAASLANYRQTLARHDWRHRIAELARLTGVEPDDAFRAELARTEAAVDLDDRAEGNLG